MAKLTSTKRNAERHVTVCHANDRLHHGVSYSPNHGGYLKLSLDSGLRSYVLTLHAGEAQLLREYLNEQYAKGEDGHLFKRREKDRLNQDLT